MPSPVGRRSVSRLIAALVLALIALARGGGVSFACDSFAPTAAPSTTHDAHSPASDEPAPEHDGCDAPEQLSECLLMPACAPAMSVVATASADAPSTTLAVTLPSPRAPAPVDRSPEPPPPRA